MRGQEESRNGEYRGSLKANTLPYPAGLGLWGPAATGRKWLSRVAKDHVPFSSDVPSSSYALSPLQKDLSLALRSLIL